MCPYSPDVQFPPQVTESLAVFPVEGNPGTTIVTAITVKPGHQLPRSHEEFMEWLKRFESYECPTLEFFEKAKQVTPFHSYRKNGNTYNHFHEVLSTYLQTELMCVDKCRRICCCWRRGIEFQSGLRTRHDDGFRRCRSP